MDLQLWGSVLGLAVLDTMSPTTLAVTIVVLLSGRRVVKRTLVYLGTLGTCYLAFGVGLMFGLGAVVDVDALMDESLDPHFFAAGAVLLVVSFVIDPGTKASKQERRQRASERAAARRAGHDRRLRRGGLVVMVGLGFTTFALEFATVLPYMAAIGLMTAAEVPVAQWLLALAVYNLIMVTPSLVLLAARVAFGDRLRDRFDSWAERLDAAARPAAAWVVGAVGALFVLDSAGTVLGSN